MVTDWITENIVEIFGAVAGIAYVILEIKRNILLWPLGIITSAVYIYVFGHNGLYANMGLQVYYLVISAYGWYMWRGAKASENTVARRASGIVDPGNPPSSLPPENPGNIQGPALNETATDVRRIDRVTAVWCLAAAATLWVVLWFILDRATDSPVPLWDGLITSLSVVATWMLTRKYLEQWYVWIMANAIAVVVYLLMGMYPTAVLFLVYFGMAIIGVRAWSRNQAVGNRE